MTKKVPAPTARKLRGPSFSVVFGRFCFARLVLPPLTFAVHGHAAIDSRLAALAAHKMRKSRAGNVNSTRPIAISVRLSCSRRCAPSQVMLAEIKKTARLTTHSARTSPHSAYCNNTHLNRTMKSRINESVWHR